MWPKQQTWYEVDFQSFIISILPKSYRNLAISSVRQTTLTIFSKIKRNCCLDRFDLLILKIQAERALEQFGPTEPMKFLQIIWD